MRILLTNDDGIESAGLRTLARVLSGAGHRVWVCAPDRERSAQSHCVTTSRHLHIERVPFEGAETAWACDGTPADCASMGLFLTKDAGVDLAVSGINRGMNMGGACVYSGTVGAAMEAAMCGAQALAVSLYFDPNGTSKEDFDAAARVALRVVEWMPAHPLPLGVMYNLNVPALPYEQLKGIVPATLAPVFLDEPSYEPDGDGGWRYRGIARPFAGESYDLTLADRGYCPLTKLTWDWRLAADDGELGSITL